MADVAAPGGVVGIISPALALLHSMHTIAGEMRGVGRRSPSPPAVHCRDVSLKPTPEQFEKLALEQLDLLYRVARRMTRNSASAEDLVQETYVRALKAREGFDLQAHGIRPWLLRIMHNVHVSRSEREGRQPASVEEDQLESASGRGAGAAVPSPYDPAGFDAMDQNLVRAIGALSSEYQVVLLLWAVDELSYKEIADAVGIPIGTVMSRLHRARQRLSEQLRSYALREGIIRE
jgi:RNA polymerase sigma-70 factor (ECF subfamily)